MLTELVIAAEPGEDVNPLIPAWYDIVGLGERDAEQCDGLDASAAAVRALLERAEDA